MNVESKKNFLLEGLRILSLGHVLAAPFGTMVLADLGAEVIKIERPSIGDDAREYGPFIDGQSGYFISINRNKKSITLDLKKGKKIFEELVKKSDVVVENFRPGTMEKLGLDYEHLKKIKPNIIYASISGFGHDAAKGFEKAPGYDIIAQASGGLMIITGQPEGPPTRVGASVADIFSGLYMDIGILSALRKRELTGKGSKIDIAMMDVVASVLENAIVRYTITGEIPRRIGTKHPSITPFDAFKAKDGWVIIACGNDALWGRFCKATKMEGLITNPRFETNRKRTENYKALKPIITEWTKNKKVSEIREILTTKGGVPTSPVNEVDEVIDHPNIKHRNMIVEVEQPKIGKIRITNTPLRFSLMPKDVETKSAPLIGEHTKEVLKELLGYNKREIMDLKEKGII